MTRSSHRWVPTDDAGLVELQDLVSGWSVQIGRPDVDDLPGGLLVDIEALVFCWADLTTQTEAETVLAEREPVHTLRAMSWVLALWAVVCETRLGKPADAILHDLDYQGGWRRDHTADEAHTWRALTQRVRIGGLAALTEDPRAVATYRRACTEPADVAPLLLRHTMIHLDAFSQDMQRHRLPPHGLVAELVAHTSPTAGPRRRLCFRPAYPADPH
jgi:hypothetical protein